MSNNKNFKVENGIQAASYYENEGTITKSEALSSIEYYTVLGDSGTFSPTLTDGMAFNDDGTKLYYTDITSDSIYEHTLSTAWDITSANTTANYTYNTSTTDSLQDPRAIAFKTDGTVMYIAGTSTADGYAIHEYTLSTAWDISTATYSTANTNFATIYYEIQFSDDGTKFYTSPSGDIHEYTLSTAWDLSTATYIQKLEPFRYGNSFALSHDGTKLFYTYAYSSLRRLYQYELSTPFDISSGTALTTYYNYAGEYIYDMFLKRGTSTQLYLAMGNTVRQLDMGYETQTCDLSTGSYFDIDINGSAEISFSNPPESGKVGTALLKVSGKPVTDKNFTFLSGVWSSNSYSYGQWGIYITPDGKQLFLNTPTIREFKMSVPWDVSTLSVGSLTADFTSLSTVEGNAIFFVDSGNKLWLFKNGTLQEFTLGSPYAINDATLNQTVTGLSGVTNSLYVGNNETKMYTAANGVIYEYTLSTAGDPSTASLTNSFTNGYTGNTYGVSLNSDGTKLYTQLYDSATTVYQVVSYSLSTPWDISTATFSADASVQGGATSTGGNSFGFFMSPDERRIIHTSYDANPVLFKIRQSDFTDSAIYRYDSSVKFSNGVSPSLPNVAGTDYLLFNTTDGGTTYQGKMLLNGVY